MGYPWPEEWRQRCLKEYQAETWEEAEEAEWLQALLEKLELTVKDLVKQMEQALNTAKEQDGPRTYLPMLESDLAMLEKLQDCKSYRAYADFFPEGIKLGASFQEKGSGGLRGKENAGEKNPGSGQG